MNVLTKFPGVMRVAVLWMLVTGALAVPDVAASATASGIEVRMSVDVPLAATGIALRLVKMDEAGWERSLALEGRSTAWFGGLPTGTYRLFVEPTGLPPLSGIVDVGHAEIVFVDVRLSRDRDHRLDVGGRWRQGEGPRFDSALLADLPAGSSAWALVETVAPFAIADAMDTGTAGLGRTALVGNRGESWALTAVALGSAGIRYPGSTGSLPVVVDTHAVQSLAVVSGLAPLEVGTPGVEMQVALVRPGDRWQGGVELAGSAPSMVGINTRLGAPSITRLSRWRDGGLFFGGPLSDRTGLFAALRHSSASFAERDRLGRAEAVVTSATVHAVRRAGPSSEWRVLGGVERSQRPFDGGRQFARSDVAERAEFGRLQATWDSTRADGFHQSLSFGGHFARRDPDVRAAEAGGVVDRVLDGAVPDPAARERRTGWNASAALSTPLIGLAGSSHAFRVGVVLDHVRLDSSIVALPTVAESVAGLPARVWRPLAPEAASERRLTDTALVVADRIGLGRSVTVDLGVRVEITSGRARGADRGILWVVPVPRMAFRWQPGRFAVYGGVGDYVAANALAIVAFGDPGRVVYNVYRWSDADGNGRVEAHEVGELVARRGRGRAVAAIDEQIRAPRTREWSVGGEWQGARSSVGGAIMIRRARPLVGSVNIGVPRSSYRSYTIPDIGADEGDPADDQQLEIFEQLPSTFGQDLYRLTNPAGAESAYDGLELYWTLASRRWRLIFGATAFRAIGRGGDLGAGPLENDPLIIGTRYENPNALKDLPGRLFADRAYVAKWSGSYRAPGDVRVAFVVRYQDGQPFTRFVVAPQLAAGPEIVHAYPVGRTRFTYTATVDTRLEKGFAIGRWRAAVRLDAFNLTNHANEVEEDVMTGLSFRRSTAVQPPRTLRLGLRLDF